MKKIFSLALAAAMLASMAVVANANPSNSHTITAAYGTPVVDGQMDDIWNNAEMQVQDSFRSGTETDAKAQIRVMYDDTYVYVLEYVPDNTLWTSDLTIANYQYDTTECCISLTNSEMTSYDGVFDWWVGITPYGVRNTDSNCAPLIGGGTDVNDAEYLTVHTSLENDPENDTAEGYWVEWAFNVKAIDEELVMDEGTTIGMEVSVNDNAEYNNRTMCMGWADTTDGASGNPSTFGNVVFGPKGGAAAAELPEGAIEYAHYVASGNDPYLNYENIIDIDPEVVTWAQIKYRTITEKDSLDNTLTGQIYITPAAEPFIPVKWNHTGNWETIVVDLTSVSEKTTLTSLWKDSLGLGFRLDPMESNRDAEANTGDDPAAVLPDSAIDVAYVAFFETEEAAKAFDGVNGAVELITPDLLLAPASSNAVAVEILSEVPAAPAVEEAPVEEAPAVEEVPAEEPVAEEVAEEAPVEEAPVEEVVEETVEEVVEEVVEEAPAAEEVVEEAPATFDAGIVAAIAAIVSAAGYALSKKNR